MGYEVTDSKFAIRNGEKAEVGRRQSGSQTPIGGFKLQASRLPASTIQRRDPPMWGGSPEERSG